jgi:hypothetical protein
MEVRESRQSETGGFLMKVKDANEFEELWFRSIPETEDLIQIAPIPLGPIGWYAQGSGLLPRCVPLVPPN